MAGDQRDPEKDLLSALKAIIATSSNVRPAETPERPNWKLFIVLIAVAFDAGMVVLLLEKFFPTISAALKIAVPTIFGVAVLAYTDDLRRVLVAWASKLWFRTLAFVPVGLYFLALLPIRVPLQAPEMVDVVVDGKHRYEGVDAFEVFIRGIRPHEVLIHEQRDVPYVDTLHITRADAFFGFLARSIRLQNQFQRVKGLKAAPVRSVFVQRADTINPSARLVVEGSFPPLYLNGRERRAGSKSVTYRLREHAMTELRLPVGTYRITMRRARCRDEVLAEAFEVTETSAIEDLELDADRPCVPRS